MSSPLFDKEIVLARDVRVGDIIVEKDGLRYCTIVEIEVRNGFMFDTFILKHPEGWDNYIMSSSDTLERLTEQGKIEYESTFKP